MSTRCFRLTIGISLFIIAIGLGIYFYGFMQSIHDMKQQKNAISQTAAATADAIPIDGTVLPNPRIIHPFHFTDNQYRPFDKTKLTGHWTLMFFGFTNCGYVCPTTLAALNTMMAHLNHLNPPLSPDLIPQVVMVSVDPERDSVARLNNYLKAFNPAFLGIRANLPETTALANQMSVVFNKVNMPNGNYMVNHSAEIMLLDPNGNIRAFLSYPHPADQLIHDYLAVIKIYGQKSESSPQAFLDNNHGKWVFINYWATWCHSCITEISQLNKFYQAHKDRAILLGVNYDGLDAEKLTQAVKQFHIHFPVLTNNPVKLLNLKESGVVPCTYVFNPAGHYVTTLLGPQTKNSLEKILAKNHS